jgi:beta-glucuronidase
MAWETIPSFETFRGKGWMRRTFCVSGDRPVRLVFGGVVHTVTVHIDGKKVGKHYDGFVPWDLVVPSLSAGEHEIVLEIDNNFGNHSALHVRGDHYSSGGIIRPAELQEVPGVFIDKVFATPKLSRGKWSLDVRVRLRNVGRSAARHVVATVAGKKLDLGEVTVAGKSTVEVSGKLTNLAVKPWSDESPMLYDLRVGLLDGEDVVDDLIDRVGFRQIEVKGSNLLLNGEPLVLRGYNRHEYHKQFGQSLPVEVMAGDVQTLKDLGCNFIRTSHYPNDMRMLDLCDEAGIYVWEETNSTSVSFKHPKYTEQITACAESMVGWHFNHPCVVIWATLNECDAKTRAGRKEHGRMLNLLRELDGSRPVTYASCAWKDDACLDLPDIISWNWYEGWYWGSIDSIQKGIDDFLGWQDRHSKGKRKPVIISEFGAGAFYGYREPTRVKWTEEYQADVLSELLRVYLNHPRICGTAMWQFCDVRISDEGDWNHRPRCINNKGTVDEMRRRKLAYEPVKQRMHEAAKLRKQSSKRRK